MKSALKFFFIFSSLVAIAGLGCQDYLYNPFFSYPERRESDYPQAGLEILTAAGMDSVDECSLEVDFKDSVFALQIQIGQVTPESVRDRYMRIDLSVTVGLRDGGLTLADTSGVVIDGPGNYPLLLAIENSSALVKGKNQVAIIAVTRYLDGWGNLVLPMGRKILYCSLDW